MDRVREDLEALKRLIKGEWVDTNLVCRALGITFFEGMEMFDFGRMTVWNPPPYEGQRIVTKFRLCEKTLCEPKTFWGEEDDFTPKKVTMAVNPETDELELTAHNLPTENS